MDPQQIVYIPKHNLSLGACIRAAMRAGKEQAEGRAFHYRVVYDHGLGRERQPRGVEIVPND